MQLKNLISPVLTTLALGAFLGLTACGDDSSSGTSAPSDPADPSLASSASTDPANPVVDPSIPASSTSTDPAQGWVPSTTLGVGASPLYAINVYNAWKTFHFVTLEEESGYYADIAGEFGYVFSAAFQPAGRVIWSAQSSGYYAKQCQDKQSTVSTMTYRGCTVSEGTGYGMLLTYFSGDDDAFIRLWNYSRAFREYNSTATSKMYLTPWITFSFLYNEIDNSSATDADLDIATALILQYYKTGNEAFKTDALNIVNAIWNEEVNKTSLLLYSGDTDMWVNDNPVYNLSYFSPVALRLFAMVDLNHDWTGVLNAMYAYMAQVQAGGTGVFPDWSNSAGIAVKPDNGSADKTYWTFNKESVRIPWRIAWDYYWFQDPRALDVLSKLNTFISTKAANDPSSAALAVNYSWNTTVGADITNTTVSTHWLAAWCATGIGTNPTWLNACTDLVNSKVPTNNGSSYFPDILLGLYSNLLNGNFVRPF